MATAGSLQVWEPFLPAGSSGAGSRNPAGDVEGNPDSSGPTLKLLSAAVGDL